MEKSTQLLPQASMPINLTRRFAVKLAVREGERRVACASGKPMQARVGPDQRKTHLTAGRDRIVGNPEVIRKQAEIAPMVSAHA